MWEDTYQVYRLIGNDYRELIASEMTIETATLLVKAWYTEHYDDQESRLEMCRQPMDGDRKSGEWVEVSEDGVLYIACSICMAHSSKGEYGQDFYSDYCPSCGARMEV